MFPQRLDSPLAYGIAKAMMDGFNRHYRLFRSESARAKHRFETADWAAQQRAQRERIEFYDLRVKEATQRLEKEFNAGEQPMDVWQQVKLHYIGLLVDHHQPELAETFFNSVTTKILHRTHFHNDFIFVRPAVSTEYIENSEPGAKPTYRAYYPTRDSLGETLVRIIHNFQLQRPFEDLDRDAGCVLEAMKARIDQVKLRANFQIQVLSSLFFRNKGAYVVGKLINGFNEIPFALPVLHRPPLGRPEAGEPPRGAAAGGGVGGGIPPLGRPEAGEPPREAAAGGGVGGGIPPLGRPEAGELPRGAAAGGGVGGADPQGTLVIDTCLFGEDELQALFSFARAYFMVDMDVPSAYVGFLRSLMPHKPRNEIYNALGLAKQGKTLFYRDFLYHLKHSSDKFRIAPGIKGMVMLVFDLPSFPYVFKLIKDWYPPPKDTTREQIKGKYLLVKQHDRVGRMADTLEYSEVAFARDRFEDELIEEIRKFAPSQLEIGDRNGDGDEEVVIKHLYIERRMIPLNIYLQEAFDAGRRGDSEQAAFARGQIERAVIEYGNAIKDLVAANIFPGDMLWKNFGVTRNGKVVFYDYDEIEYLSDCNFRTVPQPRNEEEEMSGEVWYNVGPRDVFPETFGPFLLGNPAVREVFMKHHADLLDAAFWQAHKERIQAGYVHDVFPYEQDKRFESQQARLTVATAATDATGA